MGMSSFVGVLTVLPRLVYCPSPLDILLPQTLIYSRLSDYMGKAVGIIGQKVGGVFVKSEAVGGQEDQFIYISSQVPGAPWSTILHHLKGYQPSRVSYLQAHSSTNWAYTSR